ncbi:MAG: hypothetical protein LBL00_08415, partial [Endomicrobium sp.]|nr:hypothetical protein [Endomicrobium sp.]
MKIKEKIMDYFEMHWRRQKFMKIVSLTVLVCFLLNLVQPAAYGATDDDLKKKKISTENTTSVAMPSGPGSVNRQVDLAGTQLPMEMQMEMSKQNITINNFGNIVEQGRGADKPLGSIDDLGRVITTFDNAGRTENDVNKREDLQARVNQFFEAGGMRGGEYKTTVAEEYRAVLPLIPETMNQPVDIVGMRLPEMQMEISQQNITVNKGGYVVEQGREDILLGRVDDIGRVITTFDNAGRTENDGNKKEDLQARVNQFFEAGGVVGGGYKTTVSPEFKTETRQDVKDMGAAANNAAIEVLPPANRQIDMVGTKQAETGRQNITVNKGGDVVEQGREDKPLGRVDEKGKVTETFDNNGKAENDEKKKEELQARVDQFFEAGGVRDGGYKTTVAVESRTETSQNAKDMEAGIEERKAEEQQELNQEPKAEETESLEGDIAVDSKVEEVVQNDKDEVAKKGNINEQSVDEKKENLQKARAKKKESTSVTVATIEKVQETGEERGHGLIAVRNADETQEQIALYQNENGTDNIYVGIADGQMAYANHSGSVNVQEYSETIEMEGHTYTKTEISLVEGNKEEEDGSINKKTEGLFAIETLEMVSEEAAQTGV